MARTFDAGAGSQLDLLDAPLSGPPLTIACWFRTASATLDQCLVWLGDSATFNRYFWIMASGAVAGDPVTARNRGAGGNTVATTTTGYTVDQWHHACGVFASTASKAAFIDGGSKGTSAVDAGAATINTTSMGFRYKTGAGDMTGAVADVAIWADALTDIEVLQLAQGVSPMLIQPGKLRAFWPFISNDRDVIYGYVMNPIAGPGWAAQPRKIMDQYAKWENRAGLRVPYRDRLAGRSNVPWSVRVLSTAAAIRVPRPSPAYNNLAIY